MSEQTLIYDLGDLESEIRPAIAKDEAYRRPAAAPTEVGRVATASGASFDAAGSLSLFVPGLGRMVRSDVSTGLFFLTSLLFLGALSWAIVTSLQGLTQTLVLLGLPAPTAAWSLAAIYLTGATIYLANVLLPRPHWPDLDYSDGLHPAISATASAILPGWGQLLNGNRKRAAVFLGSLWVIGAAWILAIPTVASTIDALQLYLPDPIPMLTSPAVRFTVPAMIWTLAIYDAASSAAARRQAGRPR